MDSFLDQLETCVPALRRYARALTRSADLADDLVQDCLERAIARRGLFRPSGTEPLVRIYSEAKSLKKAKDLIQFGRKFLEASL